RDTELRAGDVVVEVLDRGTGELRAAVARTRECIDARSACADECELRRNEETVGGHEHERESKAQQHVDGAQRLYDVLLTHGVNCVCPDPFLEEDRLPIRAVYFLERVPDLE